MFNKTHCSILLFAAMFGLVGGGVVSAFQKPYVDASRSFIVQNKRHAVPAAVYDYEGYYTLQTAITAARALEGWLASPGGVQAVYTDANVDGSFSNLKSYERAFAVRENNTPAFEIRFKAMSQDDAAKLSASLERSLAVRMSDLQNSDSLALVSTPVVTAFQPVEYLRNMVFGVLLILALAVFGIFFKKAIEAD